MKIVFGVIGGVLSVAILCVVAFALFASTFLNTQQDNIEWLRASIEKRANENLPDSFAIEIGKARFVSDDTLKPSIVATDISTFDQAGRLLAAVEQVAITPKLSALLGGDIKITRAELYRPKVIMWPSQKPLKSDIVDVKNDVERIKATDILIAAPRVSHSAELFNLYGRFLLQAPTDFRAIDLDQTTLPMELPEGGSDSEIIVSPLPPAISPADVLVPAYSKSIMGGAGKASDFFAVLRNLDVESIILKEANIRFMESDLSVRRSFFPLNGEFKRIDVAEEMVVQNGLGKSQSAAQFHLSLRGFCGVADLIVTHSVQDAVLGRETLGLQLKDICAADLQPKLKTMKIDLRTDIPLEFKTNITLIKRRVEKIEGAIRSELGQVAFNTRDKISYDAVNIPFKFNYETGVFTVERGQVRTPRSLLPFSGFVALPQDAGGAAVFDLKLQPTLLDMIDETVEPVLLKQARVAGVFQPQRKLLTVGTLAASGPFFSISGAGSVDFDGDTPSIAAAASISETPVKALKQIWPPFLGGGARRWVLKNANSGKITDATFEVALPHGVIGNLKRGAPLEDHQMRGQFLMQNANFKTFGELPDVVDGNVVGTILGKSFTADLESGAAQVNDNTVTLGKSQFKVPDFRRPGAKAVVNLNVTGAARTVAQIANAEPIKAMDKAKIVPKGLSGDATTDVFAEFRLIKGLKAEDVNWAAKVDVSKFASTNPIDGHSLKGANLAIKVDPVEFVVSGSGILDGVKADIDYSGATDGSGGNSTVSINLILNDKDRKKLGIDLSEYLTGPVGVGVRGKDGKKPGDIYELDLKNATMKLDFLGWSKGKGVPAKAKMRLIADGKKYRIRDLVVTGNGFSARGLVDINAAGIVERMELSRFQLRKGDKVALKMSLAKNKTYDVNISGSRFDARSFIKTVTSNKSKDTKDKYRYKVVANVGNVIGFNNVRATNVKAETTVRASSILRLKVSANVAGRPVNGSYGQSGGQDVLGFSADDAGSLFRFANVYNFMEEGALNVTASRPTGSVIMNGQAQIKDFKIFNDRALNVALRGKKKKTKRSKFQKTVFTFQDKNGVLTIPGGFLKGVEIGGTFKGVVDRNSQTMTMTGTYVPLYTLNNFISKIPLLGLALGNNQREGLLGITFEVKGSIDKPNVKVNPLSALAPGFLRQIFEFK